MDLKIPNYFKNSKKKAGNIFRNVRFINLSILKIENVRWLERVGVEKSWQSMLGNGCVREDKFERMNYPIDMGSDGIAHPLSKVFVTNVHRQCMVTFCFFVNLFTYWWVCLWPLPMSQGYITTLVLRASFNWTSLRFLLWVNVSMFWIAVNEAGRQLNSVTL